MPPLGIWSDGATMWVADDADNRIYACAVTDDLQLLPVPALTPRAALSQALSVLITHVDGGSGFMPYVDGMTVNTDTPGFRGTSDGYDSVRLQMRGSDGVVTQIGRGTGVNGDGSFQRGRTALPDGTYGIFVNSEPDRIIDTFVVYTGS